MEDILFQEVDSVVALGKWVRLKIPVGKRCNGCVVLGHAPSGPWYCGLRPSLALNYDGTSPFKDSNCPGRESPK